MAEELTAKAEEVVAVQPARKRGRPRKNPVEAVVTEAKKPAASKKAAAKKETAPKVPAKRAAKKTESVILQYAGKEVKTADILNKVTEAFIAAGNKETDMKDVTVYVKPEENKAYYVINETVTGAVEL